MNECYPHRPNTYSYREVNTYIEHIRYCTRVEKIKSTLSRSWYFRINYHSFSNFIAFTYIIQDKSQTFKNSLCPNMSIKTLEYALILACISCLNSDCLVNSQCLITCQLMSPVSHSYIPSA